MAYVCYQGGYTRTTTTHRGSGIPTVIPNIYTVKSHLAFALTIKNLLIMLSSQLKLYSLLHIVNKFDVTVYCMISY